MLVLHLDQNEYPFVMLTAVFIAAQQFYTLLIQNGLRKKYFNADFMKQFEAEH